MDIQFYAYHIPFKDHFKTAKSDFNSRNGVLIRLQKKGITAWGDAAPLPGFSPKSLDEAKRQLKNKRTIITDFFNTGFSMSDIDKLTTQFQQFPSIQFGLFTVGTSYLAQQKKQSIHQFLFNQPAEEIKMNAVIDLNGENNKQMIENQIKTGFGTIKIKVGPNPKRSLKQIDKIRTRFNNVNIRLDANQSWSLDEAAAFLSKAEPHQIEYCEEPFKKPSVQNLLMLKGRVSIPLALDETMAYWPKVEDQAFIADIFVLKPMILGSKAIINEIYDFAQKNNKTIIFTSSLGTAAERLMTASLASGYGSNNHAHGLNTGRLLKNDIWTDSNLINNGNYELPNQSQLKQLMEVDEQNLQLNTI